MLLVIDAGNTNIVIGAYQGDALLFTSRLATDHSATRDRIAVDLASILDLYDADPNRFSGAIISSVVPEITNAMKQAVLKVTGQKAYLVGPGLKTGLNIKIENPSQTGADLVVGAVAALREHKPPMIVIDMGTATTMMVLDETGAFIGGSISPGVRISQEALTNGTALLPGLQLDAPRKVIGRNTIDCMRSGIMLAHACMIDGMVERMEAELGYKTTVVATGGIAKFVLPMCRTSILYDKDLLLKGLAALYAENARD